MTALTKLLLRLSEIRQRLNELGGVETLTDEQRSETDTLTREYRDAETQSRALRVAQDEADAAASPPDPEERAMERLRSRVRLTDYLAAALEMRGVSGAALEYNQAGEIGADRFPLRLLAPEARTTTGSDGQANQGTWLDRLFAVSSAARVGVSMRPVPAGLASYPVTTAGASGQQQDRVEATGDAAWTVGVTECKPKRGSVRAVFSVEDAARLPGLEAALTRDLGAALLESIDRAIFNGDSGPSTASYDIAGLKTAAGVEKSLSQANKVKANLVLKAFVHLVDGKHASGVEDLGVVLSVGSNSLFHTTIANSAADNETIAQFLMRSGLTWGVRADIDTATASGDFGGYIGRMRGIDGAAVAAVWESGALIRDPYSAAAKGETALTLNYLWDFKVPRASNFARLKYGA